MKQDEDLESQMIEALFGQAGSPKESSSDRLKPTPGRLVTLSVRRDTGPPFRFQHKASTYHRTAAILEAEKAAKKQGLRPWALLDVSEDEGSS